MHESSRIKRSDTLAKLTGAKVQASFAERLEYAYALHRESVKVATQAATLSRSLSNTRHYHAATTCAASAHLAVNRISACMLDVESSGRSMSASEVAPFFDDVELHHDECMLHCQFVNLYAQKG